jgi:hypothetical protein
MGFEALRHKLKEALPGRWQLQWRREGPEGGAKARLEHHQHEARMAQGLPRLICPVDRECKPALPERPQDASTAIDRIGIEEGEAREKHLRGDAEPEA